MSNEIIPVESILRAGSCTPNCLLALGEENDECRCRCHGFYHGALADHVVVGNLAMRNKWYEEKDVVYLDRDEYCEIGSGNTKWDDMNRAYRMSYGRFLAVVKYGTSEYTVEAVFKDFRWNMQDTPELRRFFSVLEAAGIITSWIMPSCDYSGYGFDIAVLGIKEKNDAIVIHNQILNFIYSMDYSDDLGRLCRNLEDLLKARGIAASKREES